MDHLLYPSEIRYGRLYPLEVIELKTPWVESLTSYTCRLAEAHCVSPGHLIEREVWPLLNKQYLANCAVYGGTRFYDYSSSINGLGQTAQLWVRTMEHLTLTKDLNNTTLISWNNILPQKELLKSYRSWCPECFNQWKHDKNTIYEPLFWNIKVIEKCHVHNSMLAKVCPECKKTNQVLNRKSRVGYCNKCGAWLGKEDIQKGELDEDSLLKMEYIASNVEKLLISTPSKSTVKIDEVILLIMEKLENYSHEDFAKRIKIPKSTIHSWVRGNIRPTLLSLIEFGLKLRVPIINLLLGEKIPESIEKRIAKGFPDRIVKSKGKIDYQLVGEKLRSILMNSNEILSMSQVANKVGCSKRTLYCIFPDLCKDIARKHLNKIQRQKNERIEVLGGRIKEAVNELFDNGIYPSRRKVEQCLKRNGLLREKRLQEIWKVSICELRMDGCKDLDNV